MSSISNRNQTKIKRQSQNKQFSSLKKVSNKPLMERRRRQRINYALDQLKSLLEENSVSKESFIKLEKADILERAVKFMTHTTAEKNKANKSPRHLLDSFNTGYLACEKEIMKFLRNLYGPTNPLLALIFNYLESNKDSINCNFLQRIIPQCKSDDRIINQNPNESEPMESAKHRIINQTAFNTVWRPWEISEQQKIN